MRIITNPGSNVPAELARELDIVIAPQKISIDGVEHDTRGMTIADMEALIRVAKTHPYVLGSSAGELATLFASSPTDVIAVMTSRKLIGTYTAALSAARALKERAGHAGTNVHVIDSGSTDLGTGLPTVLAALAARAKRPALEVVALVEGFCRGGAFAFVPGSLDYLTRSGRASAFRAFFTGASTERPIVALADGEFTKAGAVSAKSLVSGLLQQTAGRLSRRQVVWIGISHAGMTAEVRELEALLRRSFDVQRCVVHELSVGAYHAFGPGTLALYVAPISAVIERALDQTAHLAVR